MLTGRTPHPARPPHRVHRQLHHLRLWHRGRRHGENLSLQQAELLLHLCRHRRTQPRRTMPGMRTQRHRTLPQLRGEDSRANHAQCLPTHVLHHTRGAMGLLALPARRGVREPGLQRHLCGEIRHDTPHRSLQGVYEDAAQLLSTGENRIPHRGHTGVEKAYRHPGSTGCRHR